MLNDRVQERLNEQIRHELQSAYIYFGMAAHFEAISLKGFANWMTVQAQEELTHAYRIFNYINDRGGRAVLKALDAPPLEWKSPLAAVTNAYEHECKVSQSINECVSLALDEKDHMTNTFLQWFVAEQVEEEATADDLVQKLKLIGDNASGLFLLDNELSKRTFAPEAESSG